MENKTMTTTATIDAINETITFSGNTYQIDDMDAVMLDCGKRYRCTFKYQDEGDVELYGEDEFRTVEIIWQTLEAWDNGELNMDDESEACDWDVFVVLDDAGNEIAKSA